MTRDFERQLELETAIHDAAIMGEIVRHWISDALGFSNAEAPRLSNDDSERVFWAVPELAAKTQEVQRIFHHRKPAAGEAS